MRYEVKIMFGPALMWQFTNLTSVFFVLVMQSPGPRDMRVEFKLSKSVWMNMERL